jgi:hypothetical protein
MLSQIMSLLRLLTLFFALWLPVQSGVAAVVHDYALDHPGSSGDHHHADQHDAPEDQAGGAAHEGSDEGLGDLAHAFCHLALSPGLIGLMSHAQFEGVHCLHPALEASYSARPPDALVRPPLARG